MNVTLPANVCAPACLDCRLRKTGAFTAVKPEVLDFIEGFRTDSLAVEAGGALVRENQTNAKLFTLYSGWAFRYKTLSDGRRPATSWGCSRSLARCRPTASRR